MVHSKNIQNFQNKTPQLATGVYVHEAATIIGEVSLGENSSVWPGAVIRGDINFIRIGKNSNIQDLSMLHVNHKSSADPEGSPILIGDNVTIGHTVILHGCTIEDECLIGMGSIVMDKVLVQKHVLLAAGSLVPEGRILDSGYLYVGRPAKKIRALTLEEIAHFMYSADNYVKLKNAYLPK
ncbi:gamma carbonic anhydrase family protein [Methylotenera sp.]|jgi:carbonic anhydrase/acetyltransferase-like protein (isoleucine patch superfamily)|uniref:gamma carbonic anhydrase family protein n=1 Tax=Methylotenera sp. TaxID=2051956 RepID=UPI0027321BEF|nr:gamma carbonic anhydrase family protein [Methylotenera sp.]MDP2229699.1 gamma carbonic anhydrase family protein [Methylotenera sp.]MDP3141974.1 gamma carbonic anhydrase family protein [Methylotenera sp.]